MRLNISTAYPSLHDIHKTVKDVDMSDELPEQELIFQYIRPGSNVLEFGGNIGRSSIIISKILNGTGIHVVFESDPASARRLKENRDQNHLFFSIINAALSEYRMAQNHWNTIVLKDDETIPVGFFPIKTITWDEFNSMYPYHFDVVVIDCEGCFHPILKSYPHIIDHARTIIIENDGNDAENQYIMDFLSERNFRSVQCRRHPYEPHRSCFYQIWKRDG